MSGHTPTPWTLDDNEMLFDKAGYLIGDLRFLATPNHKANAALIVEAVNSYAALKARVAELEADLDQALRQWKMYAENEERDLSSEKSLEGDLYRAALQRKTGS